MGQQKKLDNEGFNYMYLDARTLDTLKSLQKTGDWLATLSKEEVKQWLIDNKLIQNGEMEITQEAKKEAK